MKRYAKARKTYIDENKVRVEREAREKLPDILEYGTESDFVEAVKAWKENIPPDELKDWIRLFHVCVREKRGLG
jgi:hypothetical protein